MNKHYTLFFMCGLLLLACFASAVPFSPGVPAQAASALLTRPNPLLYTENTASSGLTKIADIGGQSRDIALNGYYAYTGEGNKLVILDVSNPAAPQLLSRLKLGESEIYNITASNDLVFVCTEYSGSFIIDVANPHTPAIAAHLPYTGWSFKSCLAGNYAILARGTNGYIIFYIVDPYQPQVVYTGSVIANAVEVVGNYCFLADYTKLTVLDISAPAAPLLAAEYPFAYNDASMLYLHNDLLFVANNNILHIYNVSNPATIAELSSYTFTAGYPYDVKMVGNLAYIADYYHIILLDLSNPANPLLLGQEDIGCLPYQLAVSGNFAYFACFYKNVQVYNCSDPADPFWFSEWTGPVPTARECVLDQNKLYVANREAGMSILDISVPQSPFLLGKYTDIFYSCNALAVKDNYVLLGDLDTLRIINCSNPQALVQVATLTLLNGYISDIKVRNSYAWVTDNYNGLIGVDISNPANPVITGNYDTPGDACHLALSGNYAWVADGSSGLRCMNIASPANPFEIAVVSSLKNAYDVEISGNYAWVVKRWNPYIYQVDISTPLLPIITDSINTQIFDPFSVLIQDNLVLIAGVQGIQGFDISNPAQPVEAVPFYQVSSWVSGMDGSAEYLFTANDGMGVEIFKLPTPSPFTGLLVTTTADSGAGSLRHAIEQANIKAGPDTIRFNIPDSDPNFNIIDGVWHIRPASPLPSITDALIIEGYSQTDFIAADTNPAGPEIQIDGSQVFSGSGLNVNDYNCEISVLAIINFPHAGIMVSIADGIKIWGCYLGINATGSAAGPNRYGLYLWGGCENSIIGPQGASQTANVISGNSETGIFIDEDSRNNNITGNIIGLNYNSNLKLGNGYAGIALQEQCNDNRIAENIISGNGNGVIITECAGNLLENNIIGTNNSLAPELGNTEYGVIIMTKAFQNKLSENIIWYNGKSGVLVNGQTSYANTISRNSIAFNTDAGIKLVNNSNDNIDPPAQLHKTWTTLSGVTRPLATVELFSDQDSQGQNYLGDTIADNSGAFSFTLPVNPSLSYYTLTATDTSGNTSAFSMSLPTDIEEQQQQKLPEHFTLDQNYPNPFNPVTTIRYGLPVAEVVTLKVFDVLGREMLTLIDAEKQSAGWHTCTFEASRLASGLYFYRLQTPHQTLWGKMTLVK
ncbi:MAG TPA: NosD domain-containing protein [bacterium]|nr:NosD domain-containing protein [bacterium]HPN46099.1 NosD domain-containing protein [bacterium]